jgi:addiction module HigA family antidote
MPKMKAHSPVHPGEILLAEFLEPYGMSQYLLAKLIAVPSRRINEIVLGKRAISPDTSLRLGRVFRVGDNFFLNLQMTFDLEREKDRMAGVLDEITPVDKPKFA